MEIRLMENISREWNLITGSSLSILIENTSLELTMVMMMKRWKDSKKAKSSIPQMVAVLGEMELRIDKSGIAYYGLENIYKKGLTGYGGFK